MSANICEAVDSSEHQVDISALVLDDNAHPFLALGDSNVRPRRSGSGIRILWRRSGSSDDDDDAWRYLVDGVSRQYGEHRSLVGAQIRDHQQKGVDVSDVEWRDLR